MTAPDPTAQQTDQQHTDEHDTTGAQQQTQTSTTTAPQGTDGAEPGAAAAGLGDAGKQAIDRMKGERNAARAENRAAIDSLADAFGSTPEQIREAIKKGTLSELIPTGQGKPADAPAAATADVERRIAEAKRSANSAASRRILKAELKAAAAGRLADPSDVALIDLDQFEVDHTGAVDDSEIAEAIDELIKRKPHLAATATRKPAFGSADAGPRTGAGAARAGQLGEADLARMSPEQIAAATDKGQFNDLLGIKT